MKRYARALIIDDDTDLCMLLKAMLKAHIPDVHFVHSLRTCRESMERVNPDIVFMDNNLPDGRGVSFIPEVKALLPNARIIVISAMTGLKVEALKFGADVFIEKPLTELNLRAAIEEMGSS